MLNEKILNTRSDLGSGRVFAEFYAPRCSFCRAAEPTVKALSEEYGDTNFIKVNTDECGFAVSEFGIRSLPTFILFENGEERSRLVGAKGVSALREMLNS